MGHALKEIHDDNKPSQFAYAKAHGVRKQALLYLEY